MIITINSGYGHDVNIAFYKIEQKKTFVEINASFSFTLRNALLKFSPSLKNAKTKQAFENTLFNYVKANLVLIDNKGKEMEFLSFNELDNNDHSGQENIKLLFKGTNLARIKNTLIFNVVDKQINYHSIISKSNEEKDFITNRKESSFSLEAKSDLNNSFLFFIPIAILLVFTIFFFLNYLNKFQKNQ
jgi:hypothetical protein